MDGLSSHGVSVPRATSCKLCCALPPTGLSPSLVGLSKPFSSFAASDLAAPPRSLATTSGILSFPQATKMFQFAWFPCAGLCVHPATTGLAPSRVSPFGHLRIISVAHTSPELFAVYRVLPRHLTPLAFPICPCSFSSTPSCGVSLPRLTTRFPALVLLSLSLLAIPLVKIPPLRTKRPNICRVATAYQPMSSHLFCSQQHRFRQVSSRSFEVVLHDFVREGSEHYRPLFAFVKCLFCVCRSIFQNRLTHNQ